MDTSCRQGTDREPFRSHDPVIACLIGRAGGHIRDLAQPAQQEFPVVFRLQFFFFLSTDYSRGLDPVRSRYRLPFQLDNTTFATLAIRNLLTDFRHGQEQQALACSHRRCGPPGGTYSHGFAALHHVRISDS